MFNVMKMQELMIYREITGQIEKIITLILFIKSIYLAWE